MHHNTRSAGKIIPLLLEQLQPHSIIDVGCGPGHWLKAWEERGVADYLGIDGFHLESSAMLIEPDKFMQFDLQNISRLALPRKYDLALCLEVAEHLPESCAGDLVRFLVTHADVVLFSAAIPFQTGENHLNEQPPQYWSDLFGEYGFRFCDIFRERLWNDPDVNWWYRQNLFIAMRKENVSPTMKPFTGNLYIHPELLTMHMRHRQAADPLPSVRHLFRRLLSTIKREK
jgi:SAM-dependent methyltransferase